MRPDEIVAEAAYLVKGQFGARMGIHHGRLIYFILLQRHRRFNGQEMDIDMGPVESRKLFRQFAYKTALDIEDQFQQQFKIMYPDKPMIHRLDKAYLDKAMERVGGVKSEDVR